MTQDKDVQDNLSLIGRIDHYVGYNTLKQNWLHIAIFTFFPILGFSLIAGFFAGETAFYECFFGALILVISLATFSVLITFLNERFQGTNQKFVELQKSIAELDDVLVPFLASIKQFESRLTELMAVLPKEAALTYQKSKSLSVALLNREQTVIKFRDNEGAEGIEAALELLKLPIDLKFDALNSVSDTPMPKSIEAKEWKELVEKLHSELRQYLTRR